jgi:hypothetical protein
MYLSKVNFMNSFIESCSLPKIYRVGRLRDLKALVISVTTQLETGLEEIMRENGD